MGGVVILLAFTLTYIKFSPVDTDFYVMIVATLGFGLIGFLDDYIKIVFRRSLGTHGQAEAVWTASVFRHYVLAVDLQRP